jgi:hypothetical protein
VVVRSCLLVLLGLILNSDGGRNDLSKLRYRHQDLWFSLVVLVNFILKDSAVYLCNVFPPFIRDVVYPNYVCYEDGAGFI